MTDRICKKCKKTSNKWGTEDLCLTCFNLPKPKYLYDVKVEAMLPATLVYKILAESPEQAVDLIRGKQPVSVQYKLAGRKELKARVFDAGCLILKYARSLVGMLR